MAASVTTEPCFYCGMASTHVCTSCGHYVCNSPICNGLATIDGSKRAVKRVVRTTSNMTSKLLQRLSRT